jgi:hypothetical protein
VRRRTGLSVDPASAVHGGKVDLTATLTASGSPPPPVVGVVVGFTLNGAAVGSATTDGSGVARLSDVPLGSTNAGTYATGVGASFAGDALHLPSSATNSLTVGQAGTSTSVADKTVTYGVASVTLTATVMANSPSTATVNQGTVTFTVKQGSTTIGAPATSPALTNGTASATYTLPSGTAAGSYTIEATYSGGTNFTASGGTATLAVAKADTATNAADKSATVGDPSVTLSATVAAVSPSTATVNQGTVTFTVKRASDGAMVGTAGPAAVAGGAASAGFSLAGLSAGTYTIEASYGGGTSFNPSVDPTPATLTINKKATSLSVPAVTGTYRGPAVTLSATLTSGGAGLSGQAVDLEGRVGAARLAVRDVAEQEDGKGGDQDRAKQAEEAPRPVRLHGNARPGARAIHLKHRFHRFVQSYLKCARMWSTLELWYRNRWFSRSASSPRIRSL